jgi:hypothetical protein
LISPEAVRQVLDGGDAVVAPFLDDVGGAELAGQLLAGLVAAHDDDPLGAELAGGEHAEQADGAVPDDGDGLARGGLGGDGGEPAGAQHVGGGEQAGDEVVRRQVGRGDERAVGERDPGELGLRPDGADRVAVDARAVVAGPADLAGVVGGEERPDDELARLERRHVLADLFDDADVLVAHRHRLGTGLAAVGPQVGSADAGRRQSDDGVGRLDDGGVVSLFETDVVGGRGGRLLARRCSFSVSSRRR